jgi:regulator of cell morphogenesis and NO signaling
MKATDPNFIGRKIPEYSNVQVMSYLISTHHEFTRNIMDEIDDLIALAQKEVTEPPEELGVLANLWKKYHRDMVMHLHDEEKILFPWIRELDESGRSRDEVARNYSGSIKQMLEEHEHHEEDIERVKKLSDQLSQKGGFIPVLARLSYKLRQLTNDLEEHMRIESELLFPRILGKTPA